MPIEKRLSTIDPDQWAICSFMPIAPKTGIGALAVSAKSIRILEPFRNGGLLYLGPYLSQMFAECLPDNNKKGSHFCVTA